MLKLNSIFSFTNWYRRPGGETGAHLHREQSAGASDYTSRSSRTARSSRTTRRGRTTRRLQLVKGIVVSTVFVVSFGYIALSAIRLAGGVTRTAPAPSRFMRLQVVDGTGGKRSEFTRLAGLLPTLSDSILDITVTDRVHFVTRPVDRSLIVSRDSDMESARMLASKLGIDPENVEYVPLEVNSLQATATLVVGRDMISSEGLFSQIKGKSPQD